LNDVGHPIKLGTGGGSIASTFPLSFHGRDRSSFLGTTERAGSGKPSILGEGAELDRTLPCPVNLVDGVGNLRIGDEGFVSRIKENDRVMGSA